MIEVTEHGAGYRCLWPEHSIRIDVENIHDHHADLYAEVTILHKNGSNTFEPVKWETLNLKSGITRGKLAKALTEAWPTDSPPFDVMLEEATVRIVKALRKGEPVLEIMAGENVAPLEFLLGPIVPAGLATILFGPKASGKSTIVLGMAIALVLPWEDNPFGWQTPKENQHGLYLDWETNDKVFQRRLNRLQVGLGLPQFSIPYRRCSLPLSEDAPQLFNQIAERNVKWVIIDSMGPACGGDLNDAQQAIKVFEVLRRMKVTPIILAHTAKNSMGEKTVFGSQFFEALARSLWEVKGEPDEVTGDLRTMLIDRKSNETRKRLPMGFLTQYVDPEGPVTIHRNDECLHESEALADSLPLTERILHVLLRHGELDHAGIIEGLGGPDSSGPEKFASKVRATVSKLVKNQKIVAINGGRFGAIAQQDFDGE